MGQLIDCEPSRFLQEIDEEFLIGNSKLKGISKLRQKKYRLEIILKYLY